MTYIYKEAHEATLKYFDGDELATSVFLSKYALHNENGELLEKTPDDMHRRIAKELARIEKKKFKKPMTEDEIYELLKGFKRIIPAGSCMFGIGNDYVYTSISNCQVLPKLLDSYSSIHRNDEYISQTAKRRMGCGFDISALRPKGAITKNAARTSSGIIPFMERFSETVRQVGMAGRRGALLLLINVHHPQILDFIRAKSELSKVTGANISVMITDEFMEAVKNEGKYEQRWPVDDKNPKIKKEVYAKVVWDEIIECARNTAEPGIMMLDTVRKEGPSEYYEKFKFAGGNPCLEQPMGEWQSCMLQSINLFSYVKEPFTTKAQFDYDLLKKDSYKAQRLMDDLVDIETEKINKILKKIDNDPEPKEIKRNEKELWENIKDRLITGRRVGLGATGLGDVLAALGYKYGSPKSIETSRKIYKTIKLGAYESTVDMAKELGSFSNFDFDKEKKCPFIKRIKEENKELWNNIRKFGRRNIACLTSAPTGSLSILTQTSSGIEPAYQLKYKRRKKINDNDKENKVDYTDQTGDKWQEYEVLHPKVKLWKEVTGKDNIEESPWHGYCAEDLDWKSRIKMQATIQKHIDSAISSTVNLPENITIDEISKLYINAYDSGCKGITIYRKGSRSGVLVDDMSIQKTKAPKRPKEMPCAVFRPIALSKPYTVLIGLLNGKEPYEIFATSGHDIPKSINEGTIIKIRRGHYRAELERGYIIEDLMKGATPSQDAITRLVSASLRHGADISFLAEQLSKSKGQLQSFEKALGRTLKKLVRDGTIVSGAKCDSCGGKLIYQNGCNICSKCGWSKCE